MSKNNLKIREFQQVSIKGLLYRNNKILILCATNGRWELPGGRVDFSESIEQAFQREMKEEIGFENVIMSDLINTWSYTDLRGNINYQFIMLDFEILTDESKIKLSDEHIEYKWIGRNDFEESNMHEGHKESLRKYFKI